MPSICFTTNSLSIRTVRSYGASARAAVRFPLGIVPFIDVGLTGSLAFANFGDGLSPIGSIGLVLATLLTACQLVTIDYVFVADSAGTSAGSAGQIQTFAVDSESGALRSGQPTVSSGGVGPVAMAVSGNIYHL